MIVEFEGQKHDFPDSFTPDDIASALQSVPKKKTLFSKEGIMSTVRLVGPSIARGLLGEELYAKESILQGRREGKLLARGTDTDEQLEEQIKAHRTELDALTKRMQDIAGDASLPLKMAQSAVTSVATNAPGIAAGVAMTGRPGIPKPAAMAPAMMAADTMAGGQAAAEGRGTDPNTGLPKASLEKTAEHRAVSSATEVGFELMPTSWLLKNLGNAGAFKFVKEYFLRELATELPTIAAQKFSERIALDPDKPLGEFMHELGEDLLVTAGSVGMAGPATGLGARGLSAVINPTRAASTPAPGASPAVPPSPGAAPPAAGPNGADNAPLSGQSPPAPPPPPATTRPPDVPPPAPFDQPTDGGLLKPVEPDVQAIIDSMDPEKITDEEVANAKALVAKIEADRKAPKSPEAETAWSGLLSAKVSSDAGEIGSTTRQDANGVNYTNPNDAFDRYDRTITYSTQDPDAVGKTPRQVMPKAGTYVLGQESDDRSMELLRANADTVEQWRQKYLPNAVFVVSNETLPAGNSLGTHYSPGAGQHFIVPGVIRKPSQGLKKFNPNTKAGVFYTLTHEFGHALIDDRFFGEMSPLVAASARQESASLGVISEGTIVAMPPLQQAVAREYNAIKSRILDGSLTAQEFVDKWIGPAKAGREFLKELNVAPQDNALAVLKAMNNKAQTSGRSRGLKGAQLKAIVTKNNNEFFNIDEFLAEQTARAAYQQKWDQTSPLGQFFKDTLAKLRQFFIDNKKDGTIAPGVAFQEWLNELTPSDKETRNEERYAQAKQKGGKKATERAAKVPEESGKAAKPVQKPRKRLDKVQHNVETETDSEKQARARGLAAALVVDGTLDKRDELYKDLQTAIRDKDWTEFTDIYQAIVGKTVKFEIDNDLDFTQQAAAGPITAEEAKKPGVLADAATEWKRNGFASKYFKAWFGDWQNAPDSSMVREGAWGLNGFQGGNGKPLVLYHMTQGDFEVFGKGDIGFHFGTLRAAHNRYLATKVQGVSELPDMYAFAETIGRQDLDKFRSSRLQDLNTIPVVLNIRNPIYLAEEIASWWPSPLKFMKHLERIGILDPYETENIIQEMRDAYTPANQPMAPLYERYAPLRRALQEKGYDGMVYENTVEGDTSFVAFEPEQVKTTLGTKTFSKSPEMRYELDYDQSTESGQGASKIFGALKNFVSDPGPLRQALRNFQHLGTRVLQIQQLAKLNPQFEWLQQFMEHNIKYNTLKSKLQAPADRTTGEWKELGKENNVKVGTILRAEQEGGVLWFDLEKTPEGWRYKMSARAMEELKKRGVDVETPQGAELGKIILDAKNTLATQLDGWWSAFVAIAKNRYAANGPEAVVTALKPIARMIHELRKYPFFPQGRFGNYMVLVEKKNAQGRWEVVHREAFESKGAWREAYNKALAAATSEEQIVAKKLTDQQYVMLGMPLEFVDIVASELDLSDEQGPNGEPSQVEKLMSILSPIKAERALKNYDLKRLKLGGSNKDELRNFAAFTWHNANLIAKAQYRSEFDNAIRLAHRDERLAAQSEVPEALDLVDQISNLKSAMQRARDYVMTPPNEAQQLRTFVSILYLGLNVKTALMNLFGLMTTASHLTTKLGAVEGNKLFLKSMLQAAASIKLTDLNAARDTDYLSPELQAALDRGLEEGELSQSYAYHLAGMANSSTLWRLPAMNSVSKITRSAVDLAMWPFRLTELATRRATFLAMYQAEQMKPSAELQDLYMTAVKQTNLLQNDYTASNRVPFMMGGKYNPVPVIGGVLPIATIFMSFSQHMAFHAYGGYEIGERRLAKLEGRDSKHVLLNHTAKIWLVLLLLAGYEGLPGAENLLDLIEAVYRKLGSKVPLRQHLRELVQSFDSDLLSPGLAAHGLGHNVAGFDVSRSLGLGRMVPGTDVLAHPRDNPAEHLGVLVLDLLGPTGGVIKFGLDAVGSNKPFAESMSKLPGGVGNIYSAYQWSQHGVRAPSGARITHDLNTGQIRDLTADEIIGKALGFNPTVVSENRELRFAQYDRKIYWQTRRDMLLDDVWRARWQKDREAEADARKAVTEFNEMLGPKFKDLRVTGADIAKRIQSSEKILRADEQGLPREKRFRGLYRDIRESYGSDSSPP